MPDRSEEQIDYSLGGQYLTDEEYGQHPQPLFIQFFHSNTEKLTMIHINLTNAVLLMCIYPARYHFKISKHGKI